MHKLLDLINQPSDLKKLNKNQLNILTSEIRQLLIDTVSKTGGHLASNLGVVELTIALHLTFDAPNDKIIWDVGHQSYVHKILTKRKDKLDSLRKSGGLSGFPKTSESIYDSFNTGHSSTSISAALGMARARDLQGGSHKVVAVIGDGAMTGGLAFEGLNDAGRSKTNLIIILNDNEMSVSKNVGGLSLYLSKIRTHTSYFKVKSAIEKTFNRSRIGKKALSMLSKTKGGIKYMLMPRTIFEELGITYLGPIDGHDIGTLTNIFNRAKKVSGPVLIHVKTKKGKGYSYAEAKPQAFHGISKFDVESGMVLSGKKKKDYSIVFGKKLRDIAKRNKRIVAISPAMPLGSGLIPFINKFPSRFFDVGIAESHAVTCAAGLAISGYIPVVCIYSSFLQRAYDQVLHDVAMQNLHMVLCIDRAGVVGEDGETHQGIFDISFLSHIPNMSILAPSSFKELEQMLEYAVLNHNAPIAIRYPRGNKQALFNDNAFEYGKGEVVMDGTDVAIIAAGPILENAYGAAVMLKEKGISAKVINIKTIKPIDRELIVNTVKEVKKIITVEDGVVQGGMGCIVNSVIKENNSDVKVYNLGYKDTFIHQATQQQIFEQYGLDEKGIFDFVLKVV